MCFRKMNEFTEKPWEGQHAGTREGLLRWGARPAFPVGSGPFLCFLPLEGFALREVSLHLVTEENS